MVGINDPKHTVFICPEWKEDREEMDKLKSKKENLISIMLERELVIIACYIKKL